MSYSTIKFGDNLIKNKSCTITYSGTLFQNNSEFVNIVYGFGNEWHHTKEQEMERTEEGFVVEVNMLDYDTFNFCFRNSNYEWDNNNNQNYTSPITEEVQQEVNFIINDDSVITNIMNNLCEIDVSAASNQKVIQTAEILENVEVASVAQEGTPFDIEIETNIPVGIEDSLVNITEAEGLDQDIENLFTDIYQKATSNEEQVEDQVGFDMNNLIEEILSPIVSAEMLEDENTSEETTLFEEVDDLDEEYNLDSTIDDLITDLFNNTRAYAADRKTEQEQNYDIEIDKAIDSRIDEILSETPIIKFEEIAPDTVVENTTETVEETDQVPEITKAIIAKKVPDFTVIDDEEESLIENISKDNDETTENTALIEVDTDNKFVVSTRALGKFYMFKKKVKLAFTKLFVTIPKMLSKGFDTENN